MLILIDFYGDIVHFLFLLNGILEQQIEGSQQEKMLKMFG